MDRRVRAAQGVHTLPLSELRSQDRRPSPARNLAIFGRLGNHRRGNLVHFAPRWSCFRSCLLRLFCFATSSVFVSHADRLPHFGRNGYWERKDRSEGQPQLRKAKNSSIVLDTHNYEAQARFAVSPIRARLPLRKSERIFFKGQAQDRALRGGYLLGWLLSARGGQTSCSTYRTARARPQRFQTTPVRPDLYSATKKIEFIRKSTNHV